MKFSKALKTLIAISMLFLCACNNNNKKHVNDGTYTGSANGYCGTITSEVTFEDGAITDVKVIDHHETKTWSDAAILNIPAYIVSEQSVNVDTQTGATTTSEAIKESVVNAIEKAGGNNDEWNEDKTDKRDVTHISREADVVIVGGGISGLTATLRLQQLGVSCLLIEKSDTLGGSLKYGGHYSQIVSEEENEESESINDIVNDIIGDQAEVNSKISILKDNLVDTVNWQISDLGIAFSKEYKTTSSFRGNAVKEYATSNSNVGELLSKEAEVSGADILLNTCAMTIDVDHNMNRILAINSKGDIYDIVADYIVIASGSGSVENVIYAGNDENTSDLYEIANNEGLSVSEVGSYEMSKLVYPITDEKGIDSYDAIESCIKNGMIIVDSDGKRFVNEESSREDINNAITDSKVYLVMDEAAYTKWNTKITESLSNDEKDDLEENNNNVYTAETLQEAAELSGIDYEALLNTIVEYDNEIETQETDILGRINASEMILPEETIYIVKLEAGTLSNNKSISTDENLNAMDTEGNSINNVFVIGSACGNVFGEKTVEGGMNAWAFVSGKYIADKIAESYE